MTLKGLLKTPEQEDDYYRNRGPIPPFRNEFGCIQDVVGYTSNDAVLGTVNRSCFCHNCDAKPANVSMSRYYIMNSSL